MKYFKHLLYIVCCCWLAVACGPSVPDTFTDNDRLPRIYPDYVEVTIPVNIAPLTFQLDEPATRQAARRLSVPERCSPHKVSGARW